MHSGPRSQEIPHIRQRSSNPAPHIITSAHELATLVRAALDHPQVAIDLEGNGFHRYPERICLVQIALADDIYLVDPLDIDDMSPLGELLAAPAVTKIFHSADNDIRSLDRDWAFTVAPLFDTAIAAAFCGYDKLGLAAILKECLDIDIPKTKRLQRADWTIRPLSAELREYAAEDVRHLARLSELLCDRLDALGRLDWVAEECERRAAVRHTPIDPETAFLHVKGSRELDGRGLAVLRALHDFRDDEALRRDRPPFKVFSDAAMLAIVQNPKTDLPSVKGLGRYAYGKLRSALRDAVRRGMDAPPVERPRPAPSASGRPRPSAAERNATRDRLRRLKQWRIEQGQRLGLDPALVWQAASLERLASGHAEIAQEMLSDDIRHWQRRQFGASLTAFIGDN